MKILNYFISFFKSEKKIIYIDEFDDLLQLCSYLKNESLLGIDTEFDWRNTYFPIPSLVQIASLDKIFLIDTLKLKNLEPLKKYLENKNKLLIFHSVRSDTTVLSKSLNIHIKSAFDIQVGEKILSNEGIKNYGKIVYKYIGKNLKKNETRSNWLKRPLTESQIKYAAEDVDFLVKIYKKQTKLLKKRNLLSKVLEESNKEVKLGNLSLKELRIRRYMNKFSKREKEIFLWREDIAKKSNVPTSYIFKDKYISQLSKIDKKNDNLKKKLISILGDSDLYEKFKLNFL